MKLFEHPDFEQAIIRAAEHFRSRGLRESIIEKDYFVTEALWIIEQVAGGKVIFKGGTSLSKGWNLSIVFRTGLLRGHSARGTVEVRRLPFSCGPFSSFTSDLRLPALPPYKNHLRPRPGHTEAIALHLVFPVSPDDRSTRPT